MQFNLDHEINSLYFISNGEDPFPIFPDFFSYILFSIVPISLKYVKKLINAEPKVLLFSFGEA